MIPTTWLPTRARAWREVARRIAHEIKNPLTPIQLNTQRIRRKYLEEIDDDIHPYLEAARSAALAHEIKATGYQHQYDRITPVFSDGKYFALTFRAWGDFMAAVWSEAEDRDYSYMDFYM